MKVKLVKKDGVTVTVDFLADNKRHPWRTNYWKETFPSWFPDLTWPDFFCGTRVAPKQWTSCKGNISLYTVHKTEEFRKSQRRQNSYELKIKNDTFNALYECTSYYIINLLYVYKFVNSIYKYINFISVEPKLFTTEETFWTHCTKTTIKFCKCAIKITIVTVMFNLKYHRSAIWH